ncbi:hypothetical protein EDC01DRAFT_647719 [Geopyxis carbonaria]|nr:hypothetical protein EDC01DRAFT_647719 [Geopyxis carbonaria]
MASNPTPSPKPQAPAVTSSKLRKKKYRHRTGLKLHWFTRWKFPRFTRKASRDVGRTLGEQVLQTPGDKSLIPGPTPSREVDSPHYGALRSSPGARCEPAGYGARGSVMGYSLYSADSKTVYSYRPVPPAGYAGNEYSPYTSGMTHIRELVSFEASGRVLCSATASIVQTTVDGWDPQHSASPLPHPITSSKRWFNWPRLPPLALLNRAILNHRWFGFDNVGLDLIALVSALLCSSLLFLYT